MSEDQELSTVAPGENSFLARLTRGEPIAILGVRHARTPDIVRLAKASGHHAIWVDLEHSGISIDVATQMCATATDIGLTSFVRVPEREYGAIGRLLDGGASGIIAPRIETAAQAADVVQACYFPPLGHRSAIGSLSQLGYRKLPAAELNAISNANTTVKLLIESPLGIANLPEIAQVPGVDLIGIGTNDLCAELGLAGKWQHPSVRDAHEAALAVCLAANMPLVIGGVPDPAYCADFVRRGAVPFMMTGIDSDVLLAALRERSQQALAVIDVAQQTADANASHAT